jgi:hypothetical protein
MLCVAGENARGKEEHKYKSLASEKVDNFGI